MSYVQTCLVSEQVFFGDILAGILAYHDGGQSVVSEENYVWERLSDVVFPEEGVFRQGDHNAIDLRLSPPIVGGHHTLRLRIERLEWSQSLSAKAQILIAVHDWLRDNAVQGVTLVLSGEQPTSKDSTLQQGDLQHSVALGCWRRRSTLAAGTHTQSGYRRETERGECVLVEYLDSSDPDSLRHFLFGSGILEHGVLKFEIRALIPAMHLFDGSSISWLEWSLLGDAIVERLVSGPLRALALELMPVERDSEALVFGLAGTACIENWSKANMDVKEAVKCAVREGEEGQRHESNKDSVELEVCLGEVNLSLMDLLRLRTGDKLRLQPTARHQCEIRFGGCRVATGTLKFGQGELGLLITNVAPFSS